jgi:uncharacterized protein (DUF58 family)
LVAWWRARVRAESGAGREYAAGHADTYADGYPTEGSQASQGPSQESSQSIDWIGWRSFLLALLALAVALVLALYSSSAAQAGQIWLAASSALAALVVAGWVALTIVPVLARRTTLHWFPRIDYRLTREGVVYITGIFVVALAALNTGNNLLFMVLACLLAGILVSGVISQIVLRDVELRLELPEHIFAGRPVRALAELINHKQALPSFSLRLVGSPSKSSTRAGRAKDALANDILPAPVYFPYLPRRQAVQQSVELLFPRRGLYRQESLGLQTRFPFGFLEKTRRSDSRLQAVVYPSVEAAGDFNEVLPVLTGELESFLRGRGNDLYAIRDYQSTDTARHVDWKASAKAGALQVREFAREDERQVLLVFDSALAPVVPALTGAATMPAANPIPDPAATFDRGIALCASLAWYFYELNSMLMFRTVGFETPMAPAAESIYDILRHLATAQPTPAGGRSLLDDLVDSPQVFKIILTSQPQGTIPSNLWNSSYILFLNSLAATVTTKPR